MKDSQKKTEGEFKTPANWEEQSKALKSEFSQLNNEDHVVEKGRENEMIKKINYWRTQLVKLKLDEKMKRLTELKLV